MTDAIAVQLITSVATIAAIVVTAWAGKRFAGRKLDQNSQGIKEVHTIVNSRMTDALNTIKELQDEVKRLKARRKS